MSATFSEIMNIKLAAGSRTLYLDLKQIADGARYLSISEVRRGAREERSRILVDEEYVEALHRALTAVLALLESKPPRQSHNLAERRQKHARAYQPWTAEEQQRLKEAYQGGQGVDVLA